MNDHHSRKKNPEQVRRALLDQAAALVLERGLAGVTVQAVAEAAGVTKGGLFHHFASKQALIEAMAQDLLDQLDAEIERHLAADPDAHGRFTRAYVEATFSHQGLGLQSAKAAIIVSLTLDAEVNRQWEAWLAARLERHRQTDGAPLLEIVRLAADGAWGAYVLGGGRPPLSPPEALRRQLLALTVAPGALPGADQGQ